MADYAVPKINTAYIFYVGLVSQADTKLLKANPTIAAGDFKISKDGGAFANLTNLPTVTPASGTAVQISLTSTEMNADNVVIACIDAAGAEWCDQLINIQTTARGMADLAYPATSGRSMVVDASGLVDANMVKAGPSGSGTAQTAKDIGGAVPAAAPGAANGLVIAGSNAATTFATLTSTGAFSINGVSNVSQTGDTYAIANGSSGFVAIYGKVDTEVASIITLLGTPAGASLAADVAAIKAETAGIITDTAEIGVAGAGLTNINLPNQTMDIVGNITGNLSGSVGSVTGAVGSVTGNVGGNVVGSVGSLTGHTNQTGDTYARMTKSIVTGSITGGASTTTSLNTTGLSPAAAVTDQFKGRVIIFDSDTTTANLRGQASDITASTSGGVLTVTALTTAPAAGDTFKIY